MRQQSVPKTRWRVRTSLACKVVRPPRCSGAVGAADSGLSCYRLSRWLALTGEPFCEVEGGTEVAVVMDVTLEFLDFFSKARPRALESTRRLAATAKV